jgi:hypothetical protein
MSGNAVGVMERNQYHRKAMECVAVTQTVPRTEDRIALLEVAQQFQHLANRENSRAPVINPAAEQSDGRADSREP